MHPILSARLPVFAIQGFFVSFYLLSFADVLVVQQSTPVSIQTINLAYSLQSNPILVSLRAIFFSFCYSSKYFGFYAT